MRLHLTGPVVAFALFASTAAQAATCVIITYYSDVSQARQVGWWSNCPGQKGLHGRRSQFLERETVQLRSPRPSPGSLPCEFLERGCDPLPRPHH